MGAEEVAAAAAGVEDEAVTGLAIVGDVALAAKDAAGVRAIGVEAEAQRRSGDVELGQPRLPGAGSFALPASHGDLPPKLDALRQPWRPILGYRLSLRRPEAIQGMAEDALPSSRRGFED